MKRDYVKVEATHLAIPHKGMELVQLEAKLTIMDSGEVRVTGKPFSEVLKCENEYKEHMIDRVMQTIYWEFQSKVQTILTTAKMGKSPNTIIGMLEDLDNDFKALTNAS